ncbi:MAG: hypothetical protein DCC55_15125 [Chloroflexi bacterium]|nr:MAG: hypothetical protein DCC55_15125 [Chloroflexota bacterium]
MQQSRLERRPSTWSAITRLVEGPLGWLITLVVIPVLIVAVLLLPPINLLDRLQLFTYTRVTSAGGTVADADGTTASFPPEGVTATFLAQMSSIPRASFLEGYRGLFEAARQLPEFLVARSPLYQLDLRGTAPGQVVLTIPIPNDSLPYETLSVYEWTGTAWRHVPSNILASNDIIETYLDYVPRNFMVMQTTAPVPSVAADLGLAGELPPGAAVATIQRAGLYLRGDGALEGVPPPNTDQVTVPVIRNWEGDGFTVSVVRTDLLNNMLLEPGQQENQLAAIEQVAVEQNYPGVVIDYRGVDAVPSARADFVHFMTNLANRLHNLGKTLAVRVEPATQISTDSWDTGGYDWRRLGQVADKLIVPAPLDPRAYQANGEMEALLRFATNEVERRKLQIELPAISVERSGPYMLPKGYQDALRPLLGQVQAETGAGNEVTLNLDNPRLLEKVSYDSAIGAYTYKYMDDQGLERTVYVENAQSVIHKLELLRKYNVTDVSLQSAGNVDPSIWNVLLKFQQGENLTTSGSQLSIAYTVYGADNSLVATQVRPLDDARFNFTTDLADNLRIEAQLVTDRGEALSPLQSTIVGLGNRTAAAGAEAAKEASALAAPVELPKIIASQILNVRNGPGTNYTILGQITQGSSYDILAKNPAGDWWQINIGDGTKGWVIGQLVSTAGEVSGIAVADDIPEPPQAVAAAAAPAAAPEPAEEQPVAAAAAPVVAAPPPSGGGSFGYGVQAHMVDMANEGLVMSLTKGMGFNWVKQQIEWKRFEASQGHIEFGPMDSMVNAANGAGVNLLFSVVNAPDWAREPGFDAGVGGPPQDPQTFANFLGAIAGKYCNSSLKAIEVWNEQNLHYEWGNKPLNAAEYVQLLAPSYAAIKGACPSMYVISGALTPAGSNPPYAIDDFQYLEGMFQAGVANYADGIGAHPSGYNVPASVTWEGACEAIQVNGNSFNGACDSPHHSWSFRSTMEGYWNIMNKYGASNKKIWPTEFGWAAGGAFDPRYKYADDNTFEEQAQWTVEAFQMMKNWGFVGPAFLWNLNFRMIANGTEKAQWGIVDPGGSPLPVYNALAAMPK